MGNCWFPHFQVSLCFLLMTLYFSLHTITTTIITKSSLKSSPLLSYLYYHRPNKSIKKKSYVSCMSILHWQSLSRKKKPQTKLFVFLYGDQPLGSYYSTSVKCPPHPLPGVTCLCQSVVHDTQSTNPPRETIMA